MGAIPNTVITPTAIHHYLILRLSAGTAISLDGFTKFVLARIQIARSVATNVIPIKKPKFTNSPASLPKTKDNQNNGEKKTHKGKIRKRIFH